MGSVPAGIMGREVCLCALRPCMSSQIISQEGLQPHLLAFCASVRSQMINVLQHILEKLCELAARQHFCLCGVLL